MSNRPRLSSSVSLSLLLLLALVAANASPVCAYGDQGWKPIDPAHLALKAPPVERDADAEALFWEVRVADEADGREPRTVLNHYIRIKIFTERGRESQSKIEIPFGTVFGREFKIKDVAGRTIKADGSIVELKKEDIFERTVQKMSCSNPKPTANRSTSNCPPVSTWTNFQTRQTRHGLRQLFHLLRRQGRPTPFHARFQTTRRHHPARRLRRRPHLLRTHPRRRAIPGRAGEEVAKRSRAER